MLDRKPIGNAMDLQKVLWKPLIFDLFHMFLSKISIRWSKICSKTSFSRNFLKVRSIPDGWAARNIWVLDSSKMKLSKLAIWTRNLFLCFFGHILHPSINDLKQSTTQSWQLCRLLSTRSPLVIILSFLDSSILSWMHLFRCVVKNALQAYSK